MRTLKWLIKENWEILLLFLLPVLLMLINQVWIFNRNGLIDPWVYFGYFIRLKQYLIAFPDAYYGSRLSWILPGHLAYSFFPPLVANYVLHLGFYYLATLSFYLILKPSVGRRAAFLASASMGCYSFFLLAIGWDYVDGAGIAYFLMTVLMISWAARTQNWTTWMVLSGVFFGALIYTNFVWLALSPSLVTYYVLIHYPHRRQKTKTFINVAAFLIGILAITLLLGSVNYAVGGNFFFFMPSVNLVLSSLGKLTPLRINWHQWAPNAPWLFLPLVVLVGSTITLTLSKFRKSFEQADAVPLQAIFVISCLSMIFLEVKGIGVLQTPFYASYIIPSMFLAIAAPLKSLRALSNGSFAVVASFALILMIFPLLADDWLIFSSDNQPIIFSLLFLTACLFPIASNFNQKKVGSIVSIVLLATSTSISFSPGWNASMKQLQANVLTSKAESDSHLTVSSVQKLFRDIDSTVSLLSVSYTHLTLPTNREV